MTHDSAILRLFIGDHVLSRRCTYIHEYGHAIVGTILGRQVCGIQVNPGPGLQEGHTKFAGVPREEAFERRRAVPRALQIALAKENAVIDFAGFAAEVRLTRCHWANKYIVGRGSHDCTQALEVLDAFDCLNEAWGCWQESRRLVELAWNDIYKLAEKYKAENESP